MVIITVISKYGFKAEWMENYDLDGEDVDIE